MSESGSHSVKNTEEVAQQRWQRTWAISTQTFDQTCIWVLEDLIAGMTSSTDARTELETAMAAYDLVINKAKTKYDQALAEQ